MILTKHLLLKPTQIQTDTRQKQIIHYSEPHILCKTHA